MITPLRYPGGKSKTYKLVEHLIKINNTVSYAEPYAGGAGVAIKLLLNNKVDKIYLNDYDKSIYCFWKAVVHYSDEFIRLINITDINIENWHLMKEIQNDKENINSNRKEDILKLALSTFFLNRTNRSGIIKAGVIGGKKQNGSYLMDCRFNKVNLTNRINEISKYKNRILLYNKDAEDFIKQNLSKTKNCLIFIDPPYIEKGHQLYTNFYKLDDHESISKTIKKHLEDKHWLLTYDLSDLLDDLYSDYPSDDYYLNYSVHSPRKGIEKIIFSNNLKTDNYKEFIKTVNV